MSSPVAFPTGTLDHLSTQELAADWELTAIARLLEAGMSWQGMAVPASFEDAFYRLNNLPSRLAALYRGLDPRDPDEDIVEEAEEEASSLIEQSFLLDENVDAFYDSLAWPNNMVVRRAVSAGRRDAMCPEVDSRRAALLALKRLFRFDWSAAEVMARLERTGVLGIEARTVLVTPNGATASHSLARQASGVLKQEVAVWVGASGAITRLEPR